MLNQMQTQGWFLLMKLQQYSGVIREKVFLKLIRH